MRVSFPLKALIPLAVFSLTLFAAPPDSVAQDNGWSVSAANWMQYWYHRPENIDSLTYGSTSRQDSLDNRFSVDFNLDNFYFGAWLRTFEPNLTSSSYERITQRYFGWHEDGLTVHVGNFYQTFDRGLTLNAFLDDVINFDNNIDGAKVSGQYDHLEFDVLSGRAVRFGSGEREYTIRGARGAIKPILGLKTGMSYVRFKQTSNLDFSRSEDINLTSFNQEINKGPFGLYAEYAFKRGHDQDGIAATGDGTYLSGSFSHRLFSLYGEYKNIYALLYPGPAGAFNTPPPMSHSGQSLISRDGAPGERGYQVGTLISPTFDINIDLAFSESFTRGGFVRHYLAEKYAGVRWSLSDKIVFNTHWDRVDFSIEDDIETYIDAYYYLNQAQTISATAYTKRFWPEGGADYHEDYLTLGYSRSNFLQVNIGGSLSNNDISTDPDKLAFIELIFRFKSHELMVFQGGERGGLICSSGICSVRPTFQGTRVILFSRF